MSSHSERFSDDQEPSMASPNHENGFDLEVTSKPAAGKDDIDDNLSEKEDTRTNSLRILSQKLSAALVNVSAKEDLVKQHSKVAEEAIAGWEKAENEVKILKQHLGASIQQKSALEDKVGHLDTALKECVRQLRQVRNEQDQKIQEAVLENTLNFKETKLELERKLLDLQMKLDASQSESPRKFESLRRENSALRLELCAQAEELEIRTIECDLSTRAAEMASKQQLESIKKVAKLEAECRKLKSMAFKSPSINIESVSDSQSDGGEQHRLKALIAELDQCKVDRNLLSSSSVEINLMDDFLEMERLAALHDSNGGPCQLEESELGTGPTASEESCLRAELEEKLEKMEYEKTELEEKLEKMEYEKTELEEKLEKMEYEKTELEEKLEKMEYEKNELDEKLEEMEYEKSELEEKLEKMEYEKSESEEKMVRMEEEKSELGVAIEKMEEEKKELESALIKSRHCFDLSEAQGKEAEVKAEEMKIELVKANELKGSMEGKLAAMEVEARAMSKKVSTLELEIAKERASSMEIAVKCGELEEEVLKLKEEEKIRQTAVSNNEHKVKQEELAVAAGKLAECQKTIASLGNQLRCLASLEDFLIDTPILPDSSTRAGGEDHQLKNDCKLTFSPERDSDSSSRFIDEVSPPSSSSSSACSALVSSVSSEKNRNGFAKFFSRTKSGIRLEI